MRDPPDWSGLEVTGEDNLVDGWWTFELLSNPANVRLADGARPTGY
jgi:hypothetical protein